MRKSTFYLCFVVFCCLCAFAGCKDESLDGTDATSISLRSEATPDFDWENIDWMPTPPGQSAISPPWFGQGSLTSSYGLEIVDDNKRSNGWVLLYNTFRSNGTQLINPYFVLYNKYRGIMRIYLYVTTSFVASSSYLQDGIVISSSKPTSMLNFLGQDIVDVTKNPSSYMQMQGAPADGSFPLASNKWYMLQYELAYDSSIASTNYNNIQFSWLVNYYNVTNISLGGSLEGTIKGTIGSAPNSNMFSALGGSVKDSTVTGLGVLAAVGSNVLMKSKLSGTINNSLGLSNGVFSNLITGVTNAIANGGNPQPKDVVSLLSAIIGGGGSSAIPISLTLQANITLKGTSINGGSFPSSPTSFWVPGTIFPTSYQGFTPNYNKPLGVLYLSSKPHINVKRTYITIDYETQEGDPVGSGFETISEFPTSFDYSNYLVINPEVLKIADVKILKQDLVTVHVKRTKSSSENYIVLNAKKIDYISDPYRTDKIDDDYVAIGIRFTIRVTPKDGSSPSDIYKTFALQEDLEVNEQYWRQLVPAN